MADGDKLRLIGDENTRSHTALCTMREAIFYSFVLLGSILRTGQSFLCRALTEWAIMPGVCLKCRLQLVQFGIKKKIRLQNQTLTLRFLKEGGRVGEEGKNFILLLQKPSERVSNWNTNLNCLASICSGEILLMTPFHKKRGWMKKRRERRSGGFSFLVECLLA